MGGTNMGVTSALLWRPRTFIMLMNRLIPRRVQGVIRVDSHKELKLARRKVMRSTSTPLDTRALLSWSWSREVGSARHELWTLYVCTVHYVLALLFQVFSILILHLYFHVATKYRLPHLLILGEGGSWKCNAFHYSINEMLPKRVLRRE